MPLLSGTFATTNLTELLRTITHAKQTGYLKLTDADQTGFVAMENGVILHARAGQATGLPALFQFVGWREGAYEFVEREIPPELSRDLAVYDSEVLLTGVAFKVDELNLLYDAVPSDDAVLCFNGSRDRTAGSVELNASELELLALADGNRTVREIAGRVKMSAAEVARHFAKLRLAGVLEIAQPAARPKSALAA